MRRIVTLVSCFVLALALTSAARADLVADFWEKVRAANETYDLGLVAGESAIRVVFVTSAVTPANNISQSFYQDFANLQALGNAEQSGGLITSQLVTGSLDAPQTPVWKPLVSTAGNNVAGNRDYVKNWVDGGNAAPVFNTKGELVALNGAAMIGPNRSLLNGIRYDQSGDSQVAEGSNLAVWTGTGTDGLSVLAQQSLINSYTLGAPGFEDNAAATAVGDAGQDANLNDWLYAAVVTRNATAILGGNQVFGDVGRSIYVMSGDITAVVPEPSTILLWLGMAGMAGVIYWRKRRS